MPRKRIFLLLKLAVSAGLVWVLYRKIPLADFRASMTALHAAPLLVVGVLLFVNTLLSAWKWQILLRADGVTVPLRTLFASYLIGSF